MRNIRDEYFRWLSALVSLHNWRGRSYWALGRELHRREFYALVENDRDREKDAKHLRFIFAQVRGINPRTTMAVLEGPPSCLEVLIALASAADEWLYGGEDEHEGTRKWFYQMLSNLGLAGFDDRCIGDVDRPAERITLALDIWLAREYRPDGRGGLFPIAEPTRDQRTLPIWMQLNDYLKENYHLVGEEQSD